MIQMEQLKQYILEVLGVDIQNKAVNKSELGSLPLFVSETYRLFNASIFNQDFVLVDRIDDSEFSIQQTEKHLALIGDALNKKTVLLTRSLNSWTRKRLVEKRINFVYPGKQMFLPDFLIDFREDFLLKKNSIKMKSLLPSAQFIALFRVLSREAGSIENFSFKELAKRFEYTPMAVSNAAENLKYFEICSIVGEKEKYLRFNHPVAEMWMELQSRGLLVNPVLKKICVDQKPNEVLMLRSNTSALPEYSDMNPSRQEFYAVDKTVFYGLIKSKRLENRYENEGRYCIEAWKYNPLTLAKAMGINSDVVDPLSLYLSLKPTHDERIEAALEQIIEKYIW